MQLDELFDGLQLTAEPVGVFVVSSGWPLRLPPSERATLHFVLAGRGKLGVAGAPATALTQHSLALVPAGTAHVIQGPTRHDASAPARTPDISTLARWEAGASGSDQLVVACGHVRVVHAGGFGVFDLMEEPLVLDFSSSHDMRDIFDRLLRESRAGSPGHQAMIGALLQQCLVLVFRELCEGLQCRLPWLDALDNPRLRAVIDEVMTRPQESHSVTSLATMAGMSRSAFTRDFTRGLGLTPNAFLRQVRMRRAAQLLRGTDLTIMAIAHQVGFASRSHFSHAFTSDVGQAPSLYRAEHRGEPYDSDAHVGAPRRTPGRQVREASP